MPWWLAPKCPVEADVKRWIEWRMAWLTDELGWDRILNSRVILPTEEFFPIVYHRSADAVRAMLDLICGFAAVDPTAIELDFYSDEGSAGVYAPDEGKTTIWIETSRLHDPFAVAGHDRPRIGARHLVGRGSREQGCRRSRTADRPGDRDPRTRRPHRQLGDSRGQRKDRHRRLLEHFAIGISELLHIRLRSCAFRVGAAGDQAEVGHVSTSRRPRTFSRRFAISGEDGRLHLSSTRSPSAGGGGAGSGRSPWTVRVWS